MIHDRPVFFCVWSNEDQFSCGGYVSIGKARSDIPSSVASKEEVFVRVRRKQESECGMCGFFPTVEEAVLTVSLRYPDVPIWLVNGRSRLLAAYGYPFISSEIGKDEEWTRLT